MSNDPAATVVTTPAVATPAPAPSAPAPAAPAAPAGQPTLSPAQVQEAQESFDGLPDDILAGLTVPASAPATTEEPVVAVATEPAAQPAVAPVAVATPAVATPAATQPAATTTPAAPVTTTPVATTTVDPTQPVVHQNVVLETAEQKTAREAAEAATLTKWRTDLKEKFKLSEDQAKAMLLEPEKVLPELAAALYEDIFNSVMAAIPHVVPSYVQAHQVSSAREASARKMVFDRWPALNKPEYMPVLLQVGKLFRSTNESATPEVAVDTIGKLAYTALGWAIPVEAGGTAPATPAPTTPAARPFTPAQPGGGGAAPRPAAPKNEFSDLVEGPPGSG